MAKRGAKTKLTPEMQEKICRLLEDGNYIQTACAYVGVAPETFYRWKEGNPQFCEAIEKARSKSEVDSVKRIKGAEDGGALISETRITHPDGTVEEKKTYTSPAWQASAWFLERSYPNRWGRQKLDLTVTNVPLPPKPIQEMTDAELEQYEKSVQQPSTNSTGNPEGTN